jgi:hypothetical protein
LIEWGGYLEACLTNEQLSRKAADLKQAKSDGLLTEAEYRVLCGVGAKRRVELKGQAQ